MTARATLPGRLGDPTLSPRTDPRVDPRLLAAHAGDTMAPPPPVSRASGAERVADFIGQAHAALEALHAALANDLLGDACVGPSIVYTTETIPRVDGNAITLHVYRPVAQAGSLPCTMYLHGGGMTVLSVDTKSLLENDGYALNCQVMDLLVATYDPTGAHAEDPLCWPYFAGVADLAGLPPHVIAVNELDPLRDEGVAYYRTLLRAGNAAAGRVNLGLTHAAEFLYCTALPEVYRATVADIRHFVAGV